ATVPFWRSWKTPASDQPHSLLAAAAGAASPPAGLAAFAAIYGRGCGHRAGPVAALASQGCFQRRHQVGSFPREGALLLVWLPAEVAIGGGRGVDRAIQVQMLPDATR